MKLKTENSNLLVNKLVQILSNKKIGYTVSDKSLTGKKQGEIPHIEIKLVENEIKEIENNIQNKKEVTKENITNLVNLYEKAIQYYSALNDDKFKILLKKIQNIYSNEEYTMILNKTDLMNQKYNNIINNNNNEKGVFSIAINDESSKEEESSEKKDENVTQKKSQEYNLDSDDDEDDDEEEKSKNKKNENNIQDKKNEEKEKEEEGKDEINDEKKDGNVDNTK